MKTFVVRCVDKDGVLNEWPAFVVLGDRSAVLADRMTEYAQSISLNGRESNPCTVEVQPFDVAAPLDQQEYVPWPEGIFVAISGKLDAADESLLERLVTRVGAHCFIVVDAETGIRSSWRSVVRLPPHRSWDAQWAWGLRAFLDVLLEATVHRSLLYIGSEDIVACLKGRLCQIAVSHAEGEGWAAEAAGNVVRSLSKRLDLASADAFILTFHVGTTFLMKDHSQCLATFSAAIDPAATVTVSELFTDGKRFAVSVIAATPLASAAL